MRKKADAMRGELESREVRIDDARRLQERIAQLAHVPNMEYNSPLNKICDLAPTGWTYALKRAYIGERFDVEGWMSIEEMGWEIVPTSDHPHLKSSDSPFIRNQIFANAFCHRDVVLCKIPTEILNRRKAYLAKESAKELDNLRVNQFADKMSESGVGLKNGQFLVGSAGNWNNSASQYPAAWEQSMGTS